MMNFKGISQNIKNDSITLAKTTLVSMAKESRKCDSLKVAYKLKSTSLNTLIETNLTMFDELEEQRQKRLELQKRFNEINDQNLKLAKRKKNGLFYGIGGTALGIVVGVLITK